MRVIYLDCAMGAAGDMLMGALYELLPEKDEFLRRMHALGLPGIEITAEPAVRCGISGTHMRVLVHGAEEGAAHVHVHEHAHEHGHDHEHAHEHAHEHEHAHTHTGLHEIEHRISHLDLPEAVRADVLAVYRSIADAESHVHGVPMEQIHFHEVGTLDALADVVGVCLLISMLAPEQILCSPVHVGSGQVRCAHGLLPVPAPATALLLAGIPIYGGSIRGELCTPTGAALLRRFVTKFGPMPVMRPERAGYGMGTKEFEAANCVRALLGQMDAPAEQIAELCCNLDDMTPEAIGFAMEQLLRDGALDVYTTPIGMKKCRPGVLLTVLCRPEDCERLAQELLRHTTTLGVRMAQLERRTLWRETRTVRTPDGDVRIKTATGSGIVREKAEYDDLAQLARKRSCTLSEAEALVRDTEQQTRRT